MTQQPPPTKTRQSQFRTVAGILAGFTCVIVVGPGFASLTMPRGPVMPPGTRYATYDSEFYFLGVPSSPEVARWVSFTAGPILLVVAIVLIRPFTRRSGMPKPPGGG
ncbi:hypothetical protein K227x_23330 [Rubripirellula lacrimiformis]|uniref:Uncharacterized protein n=1 Tax=Rubripirellula lacrimiformis TaxID=1930273 RepID=A0A517N9Y5_9BACT|nr:hypothetical protein K227x_23330 [Rubripirellula lacrimiformis]